MDYIKYYLKNKNKIVLRITNSMRYGRCSRPRGSKNRSRFALCGFLSPTFQPTANLRFALQGGLERRIPRTLYEVVGVKHFHIITNDENINAIKLYKKINYNKTGEILLDKTLL